jgi:hypothetical protein
MLLCKEQQCPIYFACIHGEPHNGPCYVNRVCPILKKVVYCEEKEDNDENK